MSLEVFFTAGYWWIFRSSVLEEFPITGPHESEAEANQLRAQLLADPVRLMALLSYHSAA